MINLTFGSIPSSPLSTHARSSIRCQLKRFKGIEKGRNGISALGYRCNQYLLPCFGDENNFSFDKSSEYKVWMVLFVFPCGCINGTILS